MWKISIHMGLILVGHIKRFVMIVELSAPFNTQGFCHVYYFNLSWSMRNKGR